jgi:hypothetical protein
MALGQARRHGYAVDQAVVRSYLKQIEADGRASAPSVHMALTNADAAKVIPPVGIGDISIGLGYIMGGLIANDVPPNPGLAETALFAAGQQCADGHWAFGMDREPVQSSVVTTTALTLQLLRAYAPAESSTALSGRYDKARQWLRTIATPNTEDKASQVLGLKWVGAPDADIQRPLAELVAAQRPDGGWSQIPGLRSDAYATGLSLYALHIGGGMPAGNPVYEKGVRYLLRTQDEDGTWYVNKRAMPANTYFDAGFPHGESQYISFCATCWAAIALMQNTDATAVAAR